MNLAYLDSLAGRVLEILWRASWQAALLAVMVLIVQGLLRGRLSARWRYNLWLLVLLRLMVPVTPQSQLSVFNLSKRFAGPAEPAVSVIPTASDPPAISHFSDRVDVVDVSSRTRSAKPQAGARGAVSGIAQSKSPAPIPWRLVLASAWIAGMLILFARIAHATIRLSRAVRRMSVVNAPHVLDLLRDCCDELSIGRRRRRVIVLASDDLPAPALMGVIRPRLLLPRRVLDQFAPGELRLILLHELGHLKRNDVLINWLVSLLNALHWFNPILWIAFARLRADRELATDELVLARTGDAEPSAYGDTIIKLLQSLGHPRGRRAAAPVPMVGTVGILERAHLLRRRITMIAQFRNRYARRWTLVAAVCMLALAGFGLTDAVRGDDAPKPVESAAAKIRAGSDASPQAKPTQPEPTQAAAAAAAPAPAGSAPANPATQPTWKPPNEKLNALIDETVAKMLAKSPKPSRAAIEAAMYELGQRIKREGLTFSSQGEPMNRAQVDAETEQAMKSLAARFHVPLPLRGPGQAAETTPGESVPAATAATAATQRKLGQNAPEINFTAIPFSDTIDFLRDVTDLNFFINWRALEAAGFDRNTPVTVRLKNVPFEQALRYILRDAGAGNIALDYAVVDGIVNISTADELATDTKVRVYSVARLLKEMPTTLPSGAGEEVLRSSKAEQLIQLIRETVAPDSWRDAGGPVGAIREINGRLVITQTEANHVLITKLLDEIGGNDAGVSAAGGGSEAEPVAAHK